MYAVNEALLFSRQKKGGLENHLEFIRKNITQLSAMMLKMSLKS
jgi:hypothetical protein